jgi:hypothetical protein
MRVTYLRNPVQQEKPAVISNEDRDKYFTLGDMEGIFTENEGRIVNEFL